MRRLFFLLFALLCAATAYGQGASVCPTDLCIQKGSGTTYYVSRSAGASDSNDGLAKTVGGGHGPWLHAPGMKSATGTAAATIPGPNQNVIFEGCQVWPSTDFSLQVPGRGSASGGYVYYGVDQTWWDTSGTTASTCATAWNRPVFDGGGTTAPFQGFGGAHNSCPSQSMWCPANGASYNVLDFIEFRNYGNVSGGGFVNFYQGASNQIVQNCYFHKWDEYFFSVGTGNVAANSQTITGFVPFSYSPKPRTDWLGSLPTTGSTVIDIAIYGYTPGGAQINITSISCVGGSGVNCTGGSWTFNTNIATKSSPCNGCLIVLGFGGGTATTGSGGQCTNCALYYSMIDGRDGGVYQMNPNLGCTGSTNFCATETWGGFRQPGIWIGNEVIGMCNAHVGDIGIMGDNTFEYMRVCSNPSAHSNITETTGFDQYNNAAAYYNNVARHANTIPANVANNGWSSGVPIQLQSASGATNYVFNNVSYDGIQNSQWQRGSPNAGTQIFFHNSGDCGPDTNLSFQCANGANSPQDVNFDNYFVTTSTLPFVYDNSSTPWTCSNCVVQTPTQAASSGYSSTTAQAYFPTSPSAPTVGTGSNAASRCATLAAAIPRAGAACNKTTTYGVTFSDITHAITGYGATPCNRPSTPDIGAYQFSCTSTPTAPISSCSPGPGTYSSTQTVTCTNTATEQCFTIDNSTPVTDGATGCSHGTKYTTTISIASTTTLKVVGGGTSYNDGPVLTNLYTINASSPTAPTPVCSPVAGTYNSDQSVTCTDSAPVMCVGFDGVTPITNGGTGCSVGSKYVGAITISQNTTLNVVAGGTSFADSVLLSNFYAITGTGWPIKASGRFLVDSNNNPFLLISSSPQALPYFLTPAQMQNYMDDRQHYGYNAMWIWSICGSYDNCNPNGQLQDGTLPFTSGTNENNYVLTTPNSAYWTQIDNMVNQAAADDLIVMMQPFDTGLSGQGAGNNAGCNTAGNGWMTTAESSANGTAGMFAYGQFLGNRYKNFPNIIWAVGDDFQTWGCTTGLHGGSNPAGASDNALFAQLIAGIASTDPNHLITTELNFNFSYSSQNSALTSNTTLNSIYNYTSLYDGFLSAYNNKAIPTSTIESYYMYQNNLGTLTSGNGLTWPGGVGSRTNPCGTLTTNPPCSAMGNNVYDFVVRAGDWWAMTSGGSGFIDSNFFEETNGYNWGSAYQAGIDGNDAVQKAYVANFFNAIPWQSTSPDQTNTVVTAGCGAYVTSASGNGNVLTNNHCTTIWNSNLSVTYTPFGNTLTVNLGVFSGNVNATWYDPSNGTYHTISGSPFTNSGSHNFVVPGANARGVHDWVLLLQVTPPNPPAATPVCSPVGGFFTTNQNVSCSTTSPGAVLCFNLNSNTVPTAGGSNTCGPGSTLYTGPILITLLSGPVTLRVVAGGTNYSDSSVLVNTYSVAGPPAVQEPKLLW